MDTYEARAAQKLHAALPANPRAAIRPAEAVLILLFLTLLVAWLDAGNLGAQIVEEKHDRIMATCERNTRVAVAALNGWQIQEGDVKVACKRVKK